MTTTPKSVRKKRSNYWPQSSFQKSFIRQITVCSFFGAFTASSIVLLAMLASIRSEFSDYRFERQIKTFAAVKSVAESGAFDLQLLQNPEILKQYQKRIYTKASKSALQSFSLAMLLLLPALAGIGVLMSHRMVGGVSRIEQHLEKIRRGESHETLVCREGDELQTIVESLSAIDRNYARRMKQLKISADKLRENIRVLKREVPADGNIKIILQEHDAVLAQMEQAIKAAGI